MDGEELIDFEDWEKLDLRVAQIKKVEDVEGSERLYKILLDVGELGKRIVCAGIKKYYSKEKLVGKKVVYFANLKPRRIFGIESEGMLLAASDSEKKRVVLISPEGEIENGAKIS